MMSAACWTSVRKQGSPTSPCTSAPSGHITDITFCTSVHLGASSLEIPYSRQRNGTPWRRTREVGELALDAGWRVWGPCANREQCSRCIRDTECSVIREGIQAIRVKEPFRGRPPTRRWCGASSVALRSPPWPIQLHGLDPRWKERSDWPEAKSRPLLMQAAIRALFMGAKSAVHPSRVRAEA